MKNLSKKIGAGVVASSLILGGAVSTGLVANADSVKTYQAGQVQEDEYKKDFKDTLEGRDYRLGDLELFNAAKNMFGFEVMGYYVKELKRFRIGAFELKKIPLGAVKVLGEKYKKIEQILKKENAKNYLYAGSFFMDLCKHGMSKGIKKVKIGDAVAILYFGKEAQPKSNYKTEIYEWAKGWKTSVQLSEINEGEDQKLVFNHMLNFIQENKDNNNLEAQYISEVK